MHAQDGIAKG